MSRLGNEERQKSLYAAILRYSPDAQSLREKALEHLVLISLQGSSQNAPLKTGGAAALIRIPIRIILVSKFVTCINCKSIEPE